MDEKIRNLELELIGKEENSLLGSNNDSGEIRMVGKEEIKHYDSGIGKFETYKLLDYNGNSEEFIATKGIDINKKRRDFYGQKVVPAKVFSEEQVNKLFQERADTRY